MADAADTRWGGLLARYDGLLMRPPDGDAATARAALRQPPGPQLLDWCHAPGMLATSTLRGPGAAALAQALALHLDGSDRLAACGGAAARLALRLRVKAEDLAALWRAPRPGDCWDSGWLLGGAAALGRLASWQPRRATLLLVADAPGDGAAGAADSDAAWHAVCQLLAARTTTLARPLRVLRLPVTATSDEQPLRLMPSAATPGMADNAIADTIGRLARRNRNV